MPFPNPRDTIVTRSTTTLGGQIGVGLIGDKKYLTNRMVNALPVTRKWGCPILQSITLNRDQ